MNHIYNDGLPEAIFLAIKNDQYDPGDSDFTPSSLNAPAYQRRLESDMGKELKRLKATGLLERYDELLKKVEQPASAKIWALFGSAVHYIIQLAGEMSKHLICERRYYGTVQTLFGEKKIGSQIDIHDTVKNEIQDFKTSKTYVYERYKAEGLKLEWESQLNIGRWCVWKETGKIVDTLNSVALWKDYSESRRGKVYPFSECSTLTARVWSLEETEDWIKRKVVEHESAMQSDSIDDVTPCSEEEVWAKPTKYAVTKPGSSRAYKVKDTMDEALEVLKDKPGYRIDVRKGVRTRCCRKWCSVCDICPAFKAHKEEFGES